MDSIQILPNTKHEEEEEDCLLALQLASASVLPMTMQAALELQVFEIIAKAGLGANLSPKEIASHLPTQNPEAPSMLDRMLRLLASYSVLTAAVVTHDNGLVERKYHLKDAVLDGGIPFNKVHGVHAFQYPATDSRYNQLFIKAMFNHTTIIMKKILEIYKGFEDLRELVNVGGGVGTSLNIITSKYPTIKGINFDLPHVIETAPSFPGVKHVGGDMFTSVPKGGAIFMKWILHDWSDEYCLKLLKNCYDALPSNGKLIVVEAILPVTPETDAAAKGLCQMDLIMMTQNPGGKERTDEEYEAMALGTGFAGIRKVCCVCNYWVMEFFKDV